MASQPKRKRNRVLLGVLVATTDNIKLQTLLAGKQIIYAYKALSYETVSRYTLTPNL